MVSAVSVLELAVEIEAGIVALVPGPACITLDLADVHAVTSFRPREAITRAITPMISARPASTATPTTADRVSEAADASFDAASLTVSRAAFKPIPIDAEYH